jgi:hypothetical protein
MRDCRGITPRLVTNGGRGARGPAWPMLHPYVPHCCGAQNICGLQTGELAELAESHHDATHARCFHPRCPSGERAAGSIGPGWSVVLRARGAANTLRTASRAGAGLQPPVRPSRSACARSASRSVGPVSNDPAMGEFEIGIVQAQPRSATSSPCENPVDREGWHWVSRGRRHASALPA